jgi:hypothetical protein
MNRDEPETRQERREERLQKKRDKMPQHGKGLGRFYKEAILKRIRHLREEKQKRKQL